MATVNPLPEWPTNCYAQKICVLACHPPLSVVYLKMANKFDSNNCGRMRLICDKSNRYTFFSYKYKHSPLLKKVLIRWFVNFDLKTGQANDLSGSRHEEMCIGHH